MRTAFIARTFRKIQTPSFSAPQEALLDDDFAFGRPEAVEITIGGGVKLAGDGEGHGECGGGTGQSGAGRAGHGGTVRGELATRELNRGLGAVRHEVEGNPLDEVRGGVR